MQVGIPSPASAPDCGLLRVDLLQPGDVILTRGCELISKAIQAMDGDYSHAALVLNGGCIFESDGEIVSFKPLRVIAFTDDGAMFARVPGDPQEVAVFRHPGVSSLPAEVLEKCFAKLVRDHYGKDYSLLIRLVHAACRPQTNFKNLALHLASRYARRFDILHNQEKACDVFCSELVALLFHELKLDLFDEHEPPEKVTPNMLAKSYLKSARPDPVVQLSDIKDPHPFDSVVPQELFPDEEDAVAKVANKAWRTLMGVRRVFEELSQAPELVCGGLASQRWLALAANHAALQGAYEFLAKLHDAARKLSDCRANWIIRKVESLTATQAAELARQADIGNPDLATNFIREAQILRWLYLLSTFVDSHALQLLRNVGSAKNKPQEAQRACASRKNMLLKSRRQASDLRAMNRDLAEFVSELQAETSVATSIPLATIPANVSATD